MVPGRQIMSRSNFMHACTLNSEYGQFCLYINKEMKKEDYRKLYTGLAWILVHIIQIAAMPTWRRKIFLERNPQYRTD